MKENKKRRKFPSEDLGAVVPVEFAGKQYLLVVVNHKETDDQFEVFDTIVHEAVHVWQFIKDHVGEDAPSREFEAYSIAFIATTLFKEYSRALHEER